MRSPACITKPLWRGRGDLLEGNSERYLKSTQEMISGCSPAMREAIANTLQVASTACRFTLSRTGYGVSRTILCRKQKTKLNFLRKRTRRLVRSARYGKDYERACPAART